MMHGTRKPQHSYVDEDTQFPQQRRHHPQLTLVYTERGNPNEVSESVDARSKPTAKKAQSLSVKRKDQETYKLLREIGLLLKDAHGSIPTLSPHPENGKAEELLPERYLFQWAASPDGREGALSPPDVGILLRFFMDWSFVPNRENALPSLLTSFVTSWQQQHAMNMRS